MGLPRARGDRPYQFAVSQTYEQASPRTRGSTCYCADLTVQRRGFPAHAGIDPGRPRAPPAETWLPRARGDRPLFAAAGSPPAEASPRTRGSTRVRLDLDRTRAGFPAHAGIDPWALVLSRPWTRLPRARGDRPVGFIGHCPVSKASPRTRGSTCRLTIRRDIDDGFPAHAGIDPDVHTSYEFPRRLPRARGDRPLLAAVIASYGRASPRTRGSTCGQHVRLWHFRGFPAHAGIDLSRLPLRRETKWLPRARGDRPSIKSNSASRFRASPRTRGSTRIGAVFSLFTVGFPAHAGIDPTIGQWNPRP